MFEEQREKWFGIGGTVLFHGVLLLILLFMYLSPSPRGRVAEEMLGVPVMFGNIPDAFGDDEPMGRGKGEQGSQESMSPHVVEDPLPMVESTSASNKPFVSNTNEALRTQDFEETIAIKEANRKTEEQKAREAEEQRRKAAQELLARQEAEKRGQINQQMEGLFGQGSGSGSRGNTEGTGTQGVPTGNASYGATSGIGGWGSFALGGRSLGAGGLIKPRYNVDDYGTVVVDILVDARGNVVDATIGKGTNTTSSELKEEALKAARKTKFNEVSAVTNQKGTITYKFNLN